MSFLARVLDPPSYGFEKNGVLVVPSNRQVFQEFLSHLNIFKTRKNWLPLFSWVTALSFAIPLGWFLLFHFSFPLLFAGFVYSMIVLGTHGTIWYHRYSTHRAYKFSHPFWRFFTENLVVKIIPNEVYVISHYVHHQYSEQPGDPYNVYCGWLSCFLADVNNQRIAPNLSEEDYHRASALVAHTGMRLNSYQEYLKWGSVGSPLHTMTHFALNWSFWFGVFYLVGGLSFALAIFGSCGVWAIGVRTFNYDGHGGGKDKRKDGIDFYRGDHSINQLWPGLVTGEWHNNHHLYPNGARAGFLPYQIDYAWYYIKFMHMIGAVSSYKDYKDDFYEKYYSPYLKQHASALQAI